MGVAVGDIVGNAVGVGISVGVDESEIDEVVGLDFSTPGEVVVDAHPAIAVARSTVAITDIICLLMVDHRLIFINSLTCIFLAEGFIIAGMGRPCQMNQLPVDR